MAEYVSAQDPILAMHWLFRPDKFSGKGGGITFLYNIDKGHIDYSWGMLKEGPAWFKLKDICLDGYVDTDSKEWVFAEETRSGFLKKKLRKVISSVISVLGK